MEITHSHFFFPLMKIAVTATAGFCIYSCAAKKSEFPLSRFFSHHALGFFLISLSQFVALLLIAEIQIGFLSYSSIVLYYFILNSLAYVIFVRGALFLMTSSNFNRTILPFSYFAFFSIASLVFVYYFNLQVTMATTLLLWSIIIPSAIFLGGFFLFSFFRKHKGLLPSLLLSLAWFYAAFASFRTWVTLTMKEEDFWVFLAINSPTTHLLRLAFYVFFFASIMLFFKAQKKEGEE